MARVSVEVSVGAGGPGPRDGSAALPGQQRSRSSSRCGRTRRAAARWRRWARTAARLAELDELAGSLGWAAGPARGS